MGAGAGTAEVPSPAAKSACRGVVSGPLQGAETPSVPVPYRRMGREPSGLPSDRSRFRQGAAWVALPHRGASSPAARQRLRAAARRLVVGGGAAAAAAAAAVCAAGGTSALTPAGAAWRDVWLPVAIGADWGGWQPPPMASPRQVLPRHRACPVAVSTCGRSALPACGQPPSRRQRIPPRRWAAARRGGRRSRCPSSCRHTDAPPARCKLAEGSERNPLGAIPNQPSQQNRIPPSARQ